MGGRSSREGSWRQNSSSGDSHYGYPQSSYGQESQSYVPQHSYASPQYYPPSQQELQYYPHSQDHGSDKRTIDRRYSRIADNYNSLDQVTEALANAGLESSNLIVGIDFTKSNEWTASTHDQDVFSFYPDERFCNGFEEVLSRYREIVPHLQLAGPTSFAPIIEMAMTIVEQSGGYHVLVIIADGQVTRSVDTLHGQLSPQEQKTVDAIVQASKLPLSIILVGVGDGPWDMMKEFDDNIPARAFDNFQFVNFTEIMSKNTAPSRKETEFALAALMEIPSQYKATIELNILGGQKGNVPERVPLPPPIYGAASFNSSKPSHSTSFQYGSASFSSSKPSHPTSFEPSVPPYPGDTSPVSSATPASSSTYDSQICPICLSNSKDMAFGCGHQTCEECAKGLQTCPICRSPIQTKIKLYF
ncbi:E3 ubiquitin-protein ligase RGLG2-like isoform X2 [Durio zibethinus]|uniref:E3 ubiquitin-protein ligase RGLG2-like isoform X2 n=1 Tax=Durio zibethinus TaxID=66656 RepID=A0A6P6BBA0_DURZI|nr:E3 ubiquitin-protein ligase RGLG2-like isoform X2 [Durio zibethinus]